MNYFTFNAVDILYAEEHTHENRTVLSSFARQKTVTKVLIALRNLYLK